MSYGAAPALQTAVFQRLSTVPALSAVPYRVTVRGAPVGSPSRPKAGQRFREGTRLFLIQAVTERDQFGRYLTCFAREEVPK